MQYEKKLVAGANKIIRGRESLLAVQWHVTERCINKCNHCYIYDDNYKIKQELSTDDCFKIIDKISRASRYYGTIAMISFIGGDPLMREDIIDLIKHARKQEILVQIKSVPESLDQNMIDTLTELGVKYFQLSLDGLRPMHDSFRSTGSYDNTIEAIRMLKKKKAIVTIKYTLSKINAEDMLSVMKIVSQEKVNAFTFSRYIPLGNGITKEIEVFEPEEYRNFLYRVYDVEKEILETMDTTTQFIHRDHLWELMCYEKGVYQELFKNLYFNDSVNYGGCSAWLKSIVIDTDGKCYTCRKYPKLVLGNILEKEIMELFENRDKSGFTNRKNYLKCKDCEVFSFCRSCPAISQALVNDPYKRDPYCWR